MQHKILCVLSIGLLFSIGLFSGCSKAVKPIADLYVPDRIVAKSSPKNTAKYFTDQDQIDLSALEQADLDAPGKEKEKEKFIAQAIVLSDQKCEDHKADILARENTFNMSFSTAAIVASGVAAIVAPAETAAIWAGSAAAVTGTQAVVNKELYTEKTTETIIKAMEVARTKERARLKTLIEEPGYTISKALAQIQTYHGSCSLLRGLVEVADALENRKLSDPELDRVISFLQTQIEGMVDKLDQEKGKKDKKSQKIIDQLEKSIETLESERQQKILWRAGAPQ